MRWPCQVAERCLREIGLFLAKETQLTGTVERSFWIGIQGGSCSGKTSLAAEIVRILGEDRCLTICLDMFFRPHDRLATGADPTAYDWDTPELPTGLR